MTLQWRLILSAVAALGALAAAFVWMGAQREAASAERRAAVLLTDQAALWQAVADRELKDVSAGLDRILLGTSLNLALATGDRAGIARVLRDEIVRSGIEMAELVDQDGQVVFSTLGKDARILDPFSLRDAAGTGRLRGLWPVRDHGFVLLDAHAIPMAVEPPMVLVLAQPVAPAIEGFAQRQGGAARLIDLRGRTVSGGPDDVADDMADTALAALPLRAPAALHRADGIWLGTPVMGADGGQVALLLSRRGLPPLAAPDLRLPLAALVMLALLLALNTRRLLRPVQDAIAVLGGGSIHGSEVQSLREAVETARRNARMVDEVRLQASRRQQRQERLIRAEIRKLAGALDPQGRDEMLQLLEQGDDPDARVEELGLLATVLGRLSGRIEHQHLRLNELVAELREALVTRARLAGLEQELSIARDVQLAMVPDTFPVIAGHEVAGRMVPAKEVGGDFFDFFALDEHRFALMVGDVSGKGVPAALFMAISRTLMRATARYESDPAACVASVNDLLAQENAQMLFVTLFYGVYDSRSGVLDYVNAGHNPPLLLRGGSRAEYLPATGDMALAVMEDEGYLCATITLRPGDLLLAYTDGVTEATDPDQQLFGEDRLTRLAETDGPSGPDRLVAALLDRLTDFAAGSEQADDITLLAIRRLS